jgi:hypothetical protein
MRTPRPPGGAVRSHHPLGAMNRAGSPFGELEEREFSPSDWLIQSQSRQRFESSLPSFPQTFGGRMMDVRWTSVFGLAPG